MLFWGIARNYNPGQASYGKTVGKSGEQRRRMLFYREKGEVGSTCYKRKVHWSKLGVQSTVAFHSRMSGNFIISIYDAKSHTQNREIQKQNAYWWQKGLTVSPKRHAEVLINPQCP